MRHRQTVTLLVFFAVTLALISASGQAAGVARAPETVSPGSATGGLVANGCPTFSWGQVAGARSYELVVYSVEESQESAPAVLTHRIPGSASSWTPSLERCLDSGGRYAWSVRAVGSKRPSGWSAPHLFEVAAGPSEAEFEEAMAVVQRYLAADGGSKGSAGAGPDAERLTEAGAGTSREPVPNTGGSPLDLIVQGGIQSGSLETQYIDTQEFRSSYLQFGESGNGASIWLDSVFTPFSEGRVGWDASSDELLVGNGAGTSRFVPGIHTINTTCLDGFVDCPFAASSSEGGAALSGDSATAFFSSGQLEEARIDAAIARDTELPVVYHFGGPAGSLSASVVFQFAGPTVQVTTTASQRVTGAATAGLGSTQAGSQVHINLCYQGPGSIFDFGNDYVAVDTEPFVRRAYTAAGSVVPGAGTWTVGFCARNGNAANPLNVNDYVQGWVMVTP